MAMSDQRRRLQRRHSTKGPDRWGCEMLTRTEREEIVGGSGRLSEAELLLRQRLTAALRPARPAHRGPPVGSRPPPGQKIGDPICVEAALAPLTAAGAFAEISRHPAAVRLTRAAAELPSGYCQATSGDHE